MASQGGQGPNAHRSTATSWVWCHAASSELCEQASRLPVGTDSLDGGKTGFTCIHLCGLLALGCCVCRAWATPRVAGGAWLAEVWK